MNKHTNPGFSLRKLLLTAMVAGPLATLPAPLWALPSTASTNLSVSTGAPAPTVVSTTRLDFGSPLAPVPDRAVYSWTEFGSVAQPINTADQINYFLPSASASVLNLVSANATSSTLINGQIASNGNVWVLNPNGIVIGATAQINVGGFYATTVPDALATSTFVLNGTPAFTGTPTTNVVVQNGANLQAVGSTNSINLYGKAIDVQGGNFFGNLNLRSFGGNVTLGTTGQVTVNSIGSTTSGGKLAITTGGGNVLATGGVLYAPSSAPAATVSGTGLTAVSTTSGTGALTGVTIGSGLGYTAAPTVALTAAPVGGTNATATATVNAAGQVTGFTITTAGSGYTTAPTVTLTGTATTAAIGTVALTGGVVTSIGLGSGYTANPTVTVSDGLSTYAYTPTGGGLTGGGFTSALAVVLPTYTATNNAVTVAGTTSIDAGGGSVSQGFSQLFATGGTMSFVGGGNVTLPKASLGGFTGTANNVTITTPAGLAATPNPDFILGASTIAGNLDINNNTANNGQITSSGATSVGGTISLQTTGNTLTFAGTGNLTFANIKSTSTTVITGNADITLPNSGKVAYSVPTVTIGAAPSGGTNATVGAITFNAVGQVTGVALATAGSGYTAAPTVTVSSTAYPNQSFATTLAGNTVASITTTLTPTYYQTLTAANAVANATITPAPAGGTNAVVNSITVNAAGLVTAINGIAGSGYTTAPTITLVGPNGALTEVASTTLTGGGGIATSVVIPTTGVFTLGRTLSVTTTGGKITAGTFSATSTVSLLASGDITLSGLTGPGSAVNITSTGGKISANYVQTATTANLRAAGNINLGAVYTASGAVSTVTSTTGSVTVGSYFQTGGGTNVVSAVGDIVIPQTLSTSSGGLNVTSTGGTISVGNNIVASTTATLALTTAGNIVLPNSAVNNLTVTSTAGSITQAAATAITQNTANVTNKVTLNALNDIVLVNGTNDFLAVVLVNGGGGTNGIQIADTNSIQVVGGTATKGATSIFSGIGAGTITAPAGSGFIQLGAAFINTLAQNVNTNETLVFGGNLNVTTFGTATVNNKNNPLSNGGAGLTGSVNTFANNLTVIGAVNIVTGSNTNAYLGTPGLGNLAKYSFGQVNANVGTGILTVNENTTLNLGTITAGTVNATSLNADIISGGAILADTVNVAANTIFAPGSITLNNTGNFITALNVLNANDLTVAITPRTGATATITAGSATVDGRAVVGTTSVNAVAGNLVLATAGGGDYGTVGFTASGAASVTVNDPNGVTIQNATNSGTGTVSITAAGPITLGSGIALGSTGFSYFDSTGANANITDSANGISIFGPSGFYSDNSISITKAGHSLGQVNLATTGLNGVNGTANITYTESGSANLNLVAVNSTFNAAVPQGSLSISSTNGGILQSSSLAVTVPGRALLTATNAGSIYVPTTTGATNTATFSAPTGAVTLTNPSATNNGTSGNFMNVPIAISASGNSSVAQSTFPGLTFGNVSVTNGSFTADTSLFAARTITEATGATLRILGATSLTTQGGAISVNQTGNNFGGLTLLSNVANAAGAAITIKENGTINLVSVNAGTTGAFTAASETGGIIQSGTAGIVVGGTTSLTAGAAGINLNTGVNNNTFGGSAGILLSTTGNASLQDSNATNTTLLPGTTITGTGTFLNTAGATAQIKDNGGSIVIGGATSFDVGRTGASLININGSGNSFGAVKFNAGLGGVILTETQNLNLAALSNSVGPVVLTTFGNILTSGTGGSTFGNTLRMTAFGSITISNPLFVAGQLTFSSVGATDLSILSKAGNLNFLEPVNLNSSSYKTPGP
jgi:filamentous hemagglutinin family protein